MVMCICKVYSKLYTKVNLLFAIPPENPMLKMVDQGNGSIGLNFFLGLPLGGRVDRNQTLFQGKTDQEIAGPEIPLDQGIVSCGGLIGQPDPKGFQVILNGRQDGRNVAPAFL